MSKKPAFMFYPGDWLRDTALRACSIEARGLWIDMLCIMHDGTPRGYLKAGSFAIDLPSLARMAGLSVDATSRCIDELEHRGVFSRDDTGCIFNRRMVRDSNISELRSKAGHAGAMAKWQGAIDLPDSLPAQCANANANANEDAIGSSLKGGAGGGKELNGIVEDIYQAYPRKVGKQAALKAIRLALGRVESTGWLLDRVRAFAESPAGQAGSFTPHPATWFNQGRYDDDPAEWKKAGQVPPEPKRKSIQELLDECRGDAS